MTKIEDVKNVQPLADFNWDEFENGTQNGASKSDLTKAYDETLNKIQEHQVVEGTVISVDKKEVVVNIGYKSDGIIPASEFRYNPEPGRQAWPARTLTQEGTPAEELGEHQQGFGER